MAQNVSPSLPGFSGTTLRESSRIELAFDRYLVPFTVTRQSFQLHDLRGVGQTPSIAYDPVARIVAITPAAPLQADQTYAISIDPNGLRAVDGATLDPKYKTIEFSVIADDAGPPQPAAPTIDFCNDILPIFTAKCGGSSCHGGAGPTATDPGPAAGLWLTSPTAIAATAVGRVAQGANTGPRASPQAPGALFGVDMPIIDPGNGAPAGGNPGNSWLVYKLLLAVPPARAGQTVLCDGGSASPTDVSGLHVVVQPAFANPAHDNARGGLSDHVLGREMPYPADPTVPLAPLEDAGAPLTIDELERVSRWIAQPQNSRGLVPPTCCTP